VDKYVIIVAGGSGVRMGSAVPKQFMLLDDQPVLMHTILSFFQAGIENIIVVVPIPFIEYWKTICNTYSFNVPHKVVGGGLFRSQSVMNGLTAVEAGEALVAIHDGVRPFVSVEIINQAFDTASEFGTGVPYLDLRDSLRQVEGNESVHVDRDKFKTVQTPQCFTLAILRKIYNSPRLPSFTDDAALAEEMGFNITLFKGSEENIKITTPLDMLVAEAILKSRKTVSNFNLTS
jgi:2-C-methyl-D-erythritol 4-phosphate cytidylyltransferase